MFPLQPFSFHELELGFPDIKQRFHFSHEHKAIEILENHTTTKHFQQQKKRTSIGCKANAGDVLQFTGNNLVISITTVKFDKIN